MFSRKYDPEWLRHHAHPVPLWKRGSYKKLVEELGICTKQEWGYAIGLRQKARARNRFWAALGYPNLVRARAAKREAERRRKLLGLKATDHSLDHILEFAAPLIPPAPFADASKKSDGDRLASDD